MYGFATDETPDLMPAPIRYAHRLAKQLHEVRKNNTLPYLRPDGKTQVTIEYDADGKVKRIHTIVLSTQHAPEVDQAQLHQDIKQYVITPIAGELIDDATIFHINPTGTFVI